MRESRISIRKKGGWICMLGLCWLAPAAAQSALRCEAVLITAERQFFNGQFDEAASAIENCLINKKNFQKQNLLQAKILLAQIYFASRKESKARKAVAEIFSLDPEYKAEPPLPPPYIAFVDAMRRAETLHSAYADRLKPVPALKKEKGLLKPWMWVGGSALIAGTAIVLMSGGADSGGFPPPPGPPGR